MLAILALEWLPWVVLLPTYYEGVGLEVVPQHTCPVASDIGCTYVMEEEQDGNVWIQKVVCGKVLIIFSGFYDVCDIFLVFVTSLILKKHSLLPNFELIILCYIS